MGIIKHLLINELKFGTLTVIRFLGHFYVRYLQAFDHSQRDDPELHLKIL